MCKIVVLDGNSFKLSLENTADSATTVFSKFLIVLGIADFKDIITTK